jgi:hypothetical protein
VGCRARERDSGVTSSEQIAQGLLVDVLVGDADHADRTARDGLGPGIVVRALGRVVVNTAVELEYEAGGRAVEVDDEARDDLLASELEPEEGAATQELPREIAAAGLGRDRGLGPAGPPSDQGMQLWSSTLTLFW